MYVSIYNRAQHLGKQTLPTYSSTGRSQKNEAVLITSLLGLPQESLRRPLRSPQAQATQVSPLGRKQL